MTTWFTADTHFHHANIIKYCDRPFKSTVEMNDTIINNWNALVKPDDLVYHIGDYTFGTEDYYFNMVFHRLNGKQVLIKGNHDKLAWKMRSKFLGSYDSYLETTVNGQQMTLCHYAMRVWNKSHYGSWNLFGHSHGTLPDDPHAKAIDVGVDCHGFKPISFEQVQAIMAKKYFKPIDHHARKEEGGIGLSKEDYAKQMRKNLYEQLQKEFKSEDKVCKVQGLASEKGCNNHQPANGVAAAT